jgi:hypothetical protein
MKAWDTHKRAATTRDLMVVETTTSNSWLIDVVQDFHVADDGQTLPIFRAEAYPFTSMREIANTIFNSRRYSWTEAPIDGHEKYYILMYC